MAQTILRRVIGPPGTGKTAWVQTFVASLPHRDVMLASHTRTAAKVLAHRVEGLDPEMIGTLHSHAYRALGRPPVAEVGKLAAEWNAAVPDEWKIGGVRDTSDPLGSEPIGDGAFGDMMRWRATNSETAEAPPRIARIMAAWQEFKAERDAVDFADMLTAPVKRNLPPPGRPRVLVVDEAQDLTAAGWALVRHWGKFVDEVVVAGDPAQTIYEWAGASPRPLLEAGWEELMLGQSYRLPGEVHRVAEGLLLQHSGELARGRWYRPRNADGAVLRSGVSLRDARAVADLLQAQAKDGTVMLLTSCGYQLRPTLGALRDAGVLFWNPYRRAEAAWNPLKIELGEGRISTYARVLAFLRPSDEVWGADARLWQAEDLTLWVKMLKAENFRERGARDRLLAVPTALDMDAVADALVDEAREGMASLSLQWLAEAVLSEYRSVVQFAERVVRKGGLSALGGTPRVIVGTIHSVKGGEADTVVLAPDASQQGMEALGTRAGRDAAVRMLYVALTRAREKVIILSPSSRLAYSI